MNCTYTAKNVRRNWVYSGVDFPLFRLLRISPFLQFQLGIHSDKVTISDWW
jgi:hypothetical protein